MNGKIGSVLRKLRKTDAGWRYGSNLSPLVGYRITRGRTISPREQEIVDSLNSDGIAFAGIEEILGGKEKFVQLESAVSRQLESMSGRIAQLQSNADDQTVGDKTFNLEALGSELLFDADSIFSQIALGSAFLNIADAYFGMRVKLRYYNIWKTFASSGSARESQLWHFDREDKYILKVFLYLDDVDEGAGPFTYAPGTHKKGKHHAIEPEFFMEGGVRRTTDAQMEAVYPSDKWVKALGKKGTIVFADTRGFHKGGEARTKDRLIYTCMYTSHASESKDLIKFEPNFDRSSLSRRQLRALGVK